MSELLPVNVNEATVVARAGQLAIPPPKLPQPPAADQLASWSQENYQMTLKGAATLGFPVAHLNAKVEHNLLIFGTSRWADVDSGDGHVYRFGVSLRVLIEVDEKASDGDLTLPAIAAKVQISDASASAQLIVRGFNSPELGKLLPPWQAFNVDSYSQYMSAVSAIQAVITENNDCIVPQLLATTIAAPALPSSAASVGTVIALRAIVAGKPLGEVLQERAQLVAQKPDEAHDDEESVTTAIEHQYQLLDVGKDQPDSTATKPDDTAIAKARDQLGSLAPAHHWWNRH